MHIALQASIEAHCIAFLAVKNPHMPARGAMSNLHYDILTGNDELLQTRDLFLACEPLSKDAEWF